MAISKFKKRYNITLTIAKVERYESLCADLGLSNQTLSSLFDESLSQTSELLQTFKNKGSLTIEDLKSLQGQQMELLEKEEKGNVRKEQKRDSASGSSDETK